MVPVSIMLEDKWLDGLVWIRGHVVYTVDYEWCQVFVLLIYNLYRPVPHEFIAILCVLKPSVKKSLELESQI